MGPNYGEEEEEGGGAKRLTLHGLLFGQRLLKKADAPPMPIAPAAPAAPSPDEAKDQNQNQNGRASGRIEVDLFIQRREGRQLFISSPISAAIKFQIIIS